MKEKNQYLFMVSLNPLRLFILGIVSFTSLFVFFSVGFLTGSYSKKTKTPNDLKSSTHFISNTNSKQTNLRFDPNFNENTNNPPALKPTTFSYTKEKSKLEDKVNISSTEILEIESKKNKKKPFIKKKEELKKKIVTEDHKKKYYIQVTLTFEKKKAYGILNYLKKKKYKADVKTTYLNGNPSYKVRIGLYHNKKKAMEDLLIIKKNKYLKKAFLRVYVAKKNLTSL